MTEVQPEEAPFQYPEAAYKPGDISKKWFATILQGKQLDLNFSAINFLLKSYMRVNLDKLNASLKSVLPYMVIVYVRQWEGWKSDSVKRLKNIESEEGKQALQEFWNYLVYKVNTLINKDYTQAVEELKTESGDNFNTLLPEFASYTLEVKCPPKMINSFVFTSSNDDVTLRIIDSTKCLSMSIAELIHWPHIQIEFKSKTLSFKRKEVSEYIRYLNVLPTRFTILDNVEENIEVVQPSVLRQSYTYNLILKYVCLYMVTIKKINNIPREKFNEIEMILKHFLRDIKDIKMNDTIVTNTAITFKVGNGKYSRSKKLLPENSTQVPVEYVEVITPKIQLTLDYFESRQMAHKQESFVDIEEMNTILEKSPYDFHFDLLPSITYTCTFCNVGFKGSKSRHQMLCHMKYAHANEHPVFCLRCKKFMVFQALASARWAHVCKATDENKN